MHTGMGAWAVDPGIQAPAPYVPVDRPASGVPPVGSDGFVYVPGQGPGQSPYYQVSGGPPVASDGPLTYAQGGVPYGVAPDDTGAAGTATGVPAQEGSLLGIPLTWWIVVGVALWLLSSSSKGRF